MIQKIQTAISNRYGTYTSPEYSNVEFYNDLTEFESIKVLILSRMITKILQPEYFHKHRLTDLTEFIKFVKTGIGFEAIFQSLREMSELKQKIDKILEIYNSYKQFQLISDPI